MSDSSSDPNVGSDMTAKRNLPSWMSSKEKGNKSVKKKQVDVCEDPTNHIEGSGNTRSSEKTPDNLHFSKFLEGVVFVLSGFVNPERSTLRSQALEMGAEYQPDWTSDCTLLVCAFPNTPKFRQVASDCGTIISKEWITECYNQKKLVDIERYLMHTGKPWRNSKQLEANLDRKNALPELPRKQVERRRAQLTGSAMPEGKLSNYGKDHFSPSKIKGWAIDDLSKTMSWLESQEEKPETNELKTIAAEGIITCLEDAIESLGQNQDIRVVIEQWKFVPQVVKELADVDGRNKRVSLSKKELSEVAAMCKKIYESEFYGLDSSTESKKCKTDGDVEGKGAENMSDDPGFDSDQTIEMTEEEIELACKQLGSEHCEL